PDVDRGAQQGEEPAQDVLADCEEEVGDGADDGDDLGGGQGLEFRGDAVHIGPGMRSKSCPRTITTVLRFSSGRWSPVRRLLRRANRSWGCSGCEWQRRLSGRLRTWT